MSRGEIMRTLFEMSDEKLCIFGAESGKKGTKFRKFSS
jgi:hypothetical protein